MENNPKIPCNHTYIVGYSFRMPQVFFRSLPCDKCGCQIRLSRLWHFLFLATQLVGCILAFCVAWSIHIEVFGTTLIASLLIFSLLFGIVEIISRGILRYAKWVEVEK